MKTITEPKQVKRATNCDGPEQWLTEQTLEVEDKDVGYGRENYLGHGQRAYVFRSSDVGRQITVSRQGPIYTCWFFQLPQKPS